MSRQDRNRSTGGHGKAPPEYRPARQQRARETERKLLAAAEQLFATQGFAATRVSDIIRLSGVSTGSYYHRFKDKRQLFDVMLDRFCESSGQTIRSLEFRPDEHPDLHAALHDLAMRYHDLVTGNRGLYRAAQELTVREPEIWGRLAALTAVLGDHMTGALSGYENEILARPRDESIRQGVQVLITLVLQMALGAGIMFPRGRAEATELAATAAMGVISPIRAARAGA